MSDGRQQFWEDTEDRYRLGVPEADPHEVEEHHGQRTRDVDRAAEILDHTGNSLFASNPAHAYDLASGFISDVPATALLRRSRLFACHARMDAKNWGASFAGYQHENKRARRHRKHLLIRVTAVEHPRHPDGEHGVRVLRDEGRTVFQCLAQVLDNMSRNSPLLNGVVHLLYIGTHDVPKNGFWVINRHYHIGVDIDRRDMHTDEDWQFVRGKIEEYLSRHGFEVYVPEDLDEYDDDDADDAARYAAGKVSDTDSPSPDAMWIYHCQTKDTDFFVPRGDFKAWRADLKDAGFRAKYGRGGVEIVEKATYASRENRAYPHAKALVNHRSDGFEMRTNLIIGNPDRVDLNPEALSGCDLEDDVRRARHLADEAVGKAIRSMSPDGKAALSDWLGHLHYNIVKSVNHVIQPSPAITSLVTGNPSRTSQVINTAMGYLPGVGRALSSNVSTSAACRIVLNAVITSARERHRSLSRIRSLAGITDAKSAGDQDGITDEMVGKWRTQAGKLLEEILNPTPKKPAKPACMSLTRRPAKDSQEDAEAAAWRQAVEDQRAEHAATIAARAEHAATLAAKKEREEEERRAAEAKAKKAGPRAVLDEQVMRQVLERAEQERQRKPTPEPEEYRPLHADYLKLEALYREFYPKAPDGALRTSVLSLEAFHAGPITAEVLAGIRSQLKPRRAA